MHKVAHASSVPDNLETRQEDANDPNDWIVFDDPDIGDTIMTISAANCIDIVIDLDDIHIEIDYDPNENVFMCKGAYDANTARQAIAGVLATEGIHTEYTLRVLIIALCSAYGAYNEDVISDMLTASFVFDEVKP